VRRLARWKRGLDSASVLDVGTHHDSPLALRTRPDLPAAQESPAYALIMLNDMLEYCADPEAELAEVRERLRPGGRAVAAISNLGSPGFTVFGGRHWGGYDFPRQRALYSPRALRLMAGRAGLEVESLASAPNAACWVESAHRWLTDWRAPRWLSRRFLPSAVVAAGVFGLVEGLMHWRGRGSILVVSLRRPG
jgi:SAM-dependent methyltransferase